jgi:hypothetical protein
MWTSYGLTRWGPWAVGGKGPQDAFDQATDAFGSALWFGPATLIYSKANKLLFRFYMAEVPSTGDHGQ